MKIRANYELNGEKQSLEFIQQGTEDVKSSMYEWMKETAKTEDTFRYLGSEVIAVIEIGQIEKEVAVAMVEEEPEQEVSIFDEEGVFGVKKIQMSSFEEWFRTFIEEKNLPVVEWSYDNPTYIDLTFDNYDAVEVIINTFDEVSQDKVKNVLVQLDLVHGDINDLLKYVMDGYVKEVILKEEA